MITRHVCPSVVCKGCLYVLMLLLGRQPGFVWGGLLAETALRQYLFPPTFDPSVRPVTRTCDNLTVLVDISLNHLVDLNEKLQILQTETWVRLEWQDPQLKWEPKNFGNISVIYVTADTIWTPDIVIYNEVGLEPGRAPTEFLISVTSNGDMQWLFPRTVETSCKMDAARYPFDVQRCDFIFGSWSLPGNLLDIRSKSDRVDILHYVDNGEWILLDVKAERHVFEYMCCSVPFPDVTFTVFLRRHSLYYIYNMIGPCILITLLHLTSFLLPAESGEKISLNVTILLGLTVFLLLVAEIMPPQSQVIPLIGQFFGICIILVSLSTVSNVFILHLHFRGSRGFPVPPRVRSVVIGTIGRCLCYGNLIVKKEQTNSKPWKPDPEVKRQTHNISGNENHCNGNAPCLEVETEVHARATLNCHDDYVLNTSSRPPMDDLGLLHRRIEDRDEEEQMILRDWILVSLILDRLFFLVFCLLDLVAIGFVLYHILRAQF